MNGIVEKIAERYADEIGNLPSLGTLTAFLLIVTSAYVTEVNHLSWLPHIDEIFSKNIAEIFNPKQGVISTTSLGSIIISSGATILLKYTYSEMLKKFFSTLASTEIISSFVSSASRIAESAGLLGATDDGCTTILSDELSTQRKSFQRFHGVAFIAFTIAALCLANLTSSVDLIIFLVCVIIIVIVEFLAIKHYLTKLFPALCVVWSAQGKSPNFGQH